MKRNVRIVIALVALGVMAGGCSRKQPVAEPTPTPPPTSSGGPTAPPPSTPPTGDDSAARAAEIRRIEGILGQIVFFDYDESVIRTDAQQTLSAKVPLLQASPTVRIRIEGHADERGSVEYNLALGMRRAQAVKDYLAGFGLSADRFEIISFGEDRPMSSGSSESSWQQNRRAEFRITGGTIVPR